MNSAAADIRPAAARVPWHRRLEPRVMAAVGLLVGGSLAAVLAATTESVTARSRSRAVADLQAARSAFDHLAADRAGFASAQASLVTALPVFRAHMTDSRLAGDVATLGALADEYQRELKADFCIVGDRDGRWTARAGWPAGAGGAAGPVGNDALGAIVAQSTHGEAARAFVPVGGALYLVVSEPARFADEVLGTLTVGYRMDNAVAARLADETHADVDIAADGVLYASSLPPADRAALAAMLAAGDRLDASGSATVRHIGSGDYVAAAFPLSSDAPSREGQLVLLQDWRPTALFVDEIRRRILLAGAGILAVALAGSFVFSRRMSRPLHELAVAAADIAGGNWARRVSPGGGAEAAMMAGAFNTMTASLQHWYEEARRRDDALRQAQKLEAIGRLAGGIAHDFNNLLMAMRGYAELLFESLDGDPRRGEAQEILNAADRAAALTKQLLAFSRRQTVTRRLLAIDQTVRHAQQMLQRLLGEQVTLATVLAPGIASIRADPSQMEQVVMNLAINARDAMPAGGRVTIEVANAAFDDIPAARRPPSLVPGTYVRMSVADTGSGMDAQTLARIFEPFFTTKEDGRGTGLGLAMVYGIVEQSGGAIDVETEIGRGTTFNVYLPAVDGDAAAADDRARAPDAAPRIRGSETVLVVEDEPRLRVFIAGALRGEGYTVLDAPDGEQALRIVRGHPEPIQLLLTDVIMPGMNGRELADVVGALRPEIRVLFMSGYPDDAILRRGIETASAQFLQKPFSLEALGSAMRSALRAPVA